jgi:hypothetical protein
VDSYLTQISLRMAADPQANLVDVALVTLEMTRISYDDGHTEPVDGRRLLATLLMYAQHMRHEHAVLADMIEALRRGDV